MMLLYINNLGVCSLLKYNHLRFTLYSPSPYNLVLEYCLALLKPYDSSAAVSAVTGRSGALVTVLGH